MSDTVIELSEDGTFELPGDPIASASAVPADVREAMSGSLEPPLDVDDDPVGGSGGDLAPDGDAALEAACRERASALGCDT